MTDKAKQIVAGRSQAMRLPEAYRSEGREVFIRRNPATGDVVLSRRPETWQGFVDLAARTEVPSDFMDERQDRPAQERDLF